MKTVYVAGNPLVKEDSVPLRIMDKLVESFPSIEFKELEPTDDMPEDRSLNIIDTVIGVDKVTIIKDIDKIVTGKVYSLHDFDLGFNLKLMKKMGKLDEVHIIGVPAVMDETQAFEGVVKALKRI
jgi:Ni,Fe-hydrogenase maturation factor